MLFFHSYAAFLEVFKESQEIGRDVTDGEVVIFFDNGKDVGEWRADRRTTVGRGRIVWDEEDRSMIRYWYAGGKQVAAAADKRYGGGAAVRLAMYGS